MERKAKISELESHAGYWLRFVSNHVSQAFARKVEAKGVSVGEWVLLRELFDAEALAPSNLADKLGLTRGAITKIADKLIGKMLILRAANPADGRAQTLALTAKGRKLVPELAALADANDSEFFGRLSAADRKTLTRILKQIAEQRDLKTVPVD